MKYAIPEYRLSLSVIGEQSPITFSDSAAVYNAIRGDLENQDREHFYVYLLDRKNGIIGKHLVGIGSQSAAIVHPREVFKAAIVGCAAAIICAHNHPSGDPGPSKEDIEITRRLQDAGRLIGIPVLDHIVIGRGRYYSFADEGMMECK